MERYVGRPPLWAFPKLPPSANLSYEQLDFDNRAYVLDMFASDPSAFVDESFKDDRKLYVYVAHNRICGPYSPKHGAADWIICRSADREPVGLIHTYDISREEFALSNRRCSIGYALSAPFHGNGLAQEAVTTLQRYLFDRFDMLLLLAYFKRDNAASARLLERLGYSDNSQAYHDDAFHFFELYRSEDARSAFMRWREDFEGRHGKTNA